MEGYFSRPRTILLVSPQPWTAPNVSKHHYARLLGDLGHRVFFVEPPDRTARGSSVTIEPSDAAGVSILRYRLPFPYRIKFHARPLFNWLMRGVVRRVSRAVPTPIDVVWDFDNEYMFDDLRHFVADFRIFHPVDDITAYGSATKHADLILANNAYYIATLPEAGARTELIPHGTQPRYVDVARARIDDLAPPFRDAPRVVGYVGNLDRSDIDWDALFGVIGAHPALAFHFIGPPPADDRVEQLRAYANARLLGRLEPEAIIAQSADIDIWFLAYRYRKVDGLIYPHKINEFLATGKPILSSQLSYGFPDGLVTTSAFDDNRDLPRLMSDLVRDYREVAAPFAAARARFAADNGYIDHVATVSRLIADVKAG